MVKYADGPTTEQSIEIAASPDAVWEIISDPGFPAEHSSELQEAAWDPDGPPPGVGARVLGRNRHEAIGEWTTTSYVVEWSEGNGWSWAVSSTEQPAAQWWFSVEPKADSCVLTQRVRLGPGPSGLSPAIERMPDREEEIVTRRLQHHDQNMRANLEAVKSQLEQH